MVAASNYVESCLELGGEWVHFCNMTTHQILLRGIIQERGTRARLDHLYEAAGGGGCLFFRADCHGSLLLREV
eukprot:6152022-Pyramimonas_sp.AAC.1